LVCQTRINVIVSCNGIIKLSKCALYIKQIYYKQNNHYSVLDMWNSIAIKINSLSVISSILIQISVLIQDAPKFLTAIV